MTDDMLALTYCPDPDCDAPAEVLDSYASYHPSSWFVFTSWTTPVPMTRLLHIRSRCLAGHVLDRVEEPA